MKRIAESHEALGGGPAAVDLHFARCKMAPCNE